MEQFVGHPYVITVDFNDPAELSGAFEQALQLNVSLGLLVLIIKVFSLCPRFLMNSLFWECLSESTLFWLIWTLALKTQIGRHLKSLLELFWPRPGSLVKRPAQRMGSCVSALSSNGSIIEGRWRTSKKLHKKSSIGWFPGIPVRKLKCFPSPTLHRFATYKEIPIYSVAHQSLQKMCSEFALVGLSTNSRRFYVMFIVDQRLFLV